MYAVIRAGGKQYRVAPGDVIRLEKQSAGTDNLEFEVLAFGNEGKVSGPQGDSRVVGEVLGEGRAKKVLVFHYKKKKQYKKLNGHRQPFTAVRITEIAFDGQTQQAPALEAKKKPTSGGAAPEEAVAPKKRTSKKASSAGAKSDTTAPHGGSVKPRKGSK